MLRICSSALVAVLEAAIIGAKADSDQGSRALGERSHVLRLLRGLNWRPASGLGPIVIAGAIYFALLARPSFPQALRGLNGGAPLSSVAGLCCSLAVFSRSPREDQPRRRPNEEL
jgi:hypothetical protein